MTYKGIDVSTWQGNIDWNKVKADKIEFAIVRGGYGTSGKDGKFEQNYKNAKAAGVPIGVYHYSYAKTIQESKKEANFCISYLEGKKFEYPIAFDIEDESQLNLSSDKLTSVVKAFCSEVQKAGYYVCIYSNLHWLKNRLNMSDLNYDIWLAQWTSKPTYGGSIGIWQYTDKGKVKGINGNVDMDIAYKDYLKIIKSAGLNGYKKETDLIRKRYSGLFPTIKDGTWLERGDRGENVKRLQRFLNWYGNYNLSVDGIFGEKTESAVKDFQKAERLTVDSMFGVKSLVKAKTVMK